MDYNKILEFLKSNKAKAFYWTTVNGMISLAILYLTDSSYTYTVVLLPILNLITKYINTEILSLE